MNPAVYTVGVAITANTPSSSGGAVTSYSVSPALPAGLSLNTTTGVISGTPTTITSTETYTITASNSAGSTSVDLVVTVNATVAPPSGLGYSTSPAVYTVGVAIVANTPSSSGGAVTSYSVSPALPAGLSLNTTTGVIYGTPTTITSTATYTITASNSAGSTSVGLTITVNGGGSGTPTLVQHVSSAENVLGAGDATGNHYRFTLPNAVLSGNALILGIAYEYGHSFSATPITDTSGTWPTTPAVTATDANGHVNIAIFVLPSATAGVHTITVNFTANTQIQYTISEFRNVATSSPVNGTTTASNVAAPNISAGTFAPGNNDANGGNLIWAFYFNDYSLGTGNTVTTFTPGSGFALLDANIGWAGSNYNMHHASQFMVQTTAAPITPGMRVTMGPTNDGFIGAAVALKAAQAGTAPSASGIRIVKVLHFTTTDPPANWVLQVPTTGNLVVLVLNESNVIVVSGVTDTASNAYTKYEPTFDVPQFWVAGNSTPSNTLKVTLANAGTSTVSLTAYDITGAATSPVGTVASTATTSLNNATVFNHAPDITPSASPGLTIAACGLGQGPATGFNTGAPSGAIFDFVNYTGQTDMSWFDNSDCRAHVYHSATSQQTWNWTITSVASNSGFATALEFKQ